MHVWPELENLHSCVLTVVNQDTGQHGEACSDASYSSLSQLGCIVICIGCV